MGCVIGVELGQGQRCSAFCLVEGDRRPIAGTRDKEEHFVVHHLDRLPAGQPFPQVAGRLGEILTALNRRLEDSLSHFREPEPEPEPKVYINATGLGEPIMEIFRRTAEDLLPVYFNHGDRRAEAWRKEVTLGKAWLVARIQALLQTGHLHLPRTSEAQRLADELLAYEIEVSTDANERYGAFRVGRNDDLITALGLAVQTDTPRYNPPLIVLCG